MCTAYYFHFDSMYSVHVLQLNNKKNKNLVKLVDDKYKAKIRPEDDLTLAMTKFFHRLSIELNC